MTTLGIDEVGRGPWAGPLVIGAVILGDQYHDWFDELTDSKKLTAKKRELLAEKIQNEAAASALGWVSSTELDQIGLGPALRLATRRAVSQIQSAKVSFTEIIIDGTVNFLSDTSLGSHVSILKKADLTVKEVSAASIIAKVARDHYMVELAEKYPMYGFEKHVGYGTALHRKALEEFGPCPEHRQSFRPVTQCGTLCGRSFGASVDGSVNSDKITSNHQNAKNIRLANTTSIGQRAESAVANYLEALGHTIIARNHKTKFYEIDIISAFSGKIYFTEVKYRKNSYHGGPLEFITPQKLEQMQFAAKSYLKFLAGSAEQKNANLQPILAAAAVSGPEFKVEDWFTLNG